MTYQGGKRFFRLVLYILISANLWTLGFFVSYAISPGELLIDRLQITGGTGKTDNDFITIYNNSQNILDLNGLRLIKRTANGTSDITIKSWVEPTFLNPGASYTWANSNNGFANLIQAQTSSTQTIANDNGIALRIGAENNGEILDSVGWGNVFNALIEMLGFPTNPTANQTLERINHQDTNNNSLDFHLTPTIFPSLCGNGIKENSEECDDGNTSNGDGCDGLCHLETTAAICGNNVVENGEGCDDGNTDNNDGCSSLCQLEVMTQADIYINEFVPDPVSGSHEWVELFTPSSTLVTITDWSLEDGAGTKTRVSGNLGGTHKFLVIEKPTGALNNSGDLIILRNNQGDIIDKVAYGDWDDENSNDNAPTASDPYSIARKQDGITTDNDSFDFAVTNLVTKNAPNIIQSPAIEENEETNIKPDVVISEIYPNPYGIDGTAVQKEFIEIYNHGETTVNLNGWHLEIGAKEYIYTIDSDLLISPKNYYIFSSSYYKLPNNGSSVKLFQPGKVTAYQTVTYKEAPEGQGWMLLNEVKNNNSSIWQWTKEPTPQKLNIVMTGPVARFDIIGNLITNQRLTFDNSDSETNGIPTTFTWNFGDSTVGNGTSPQHIFTKPGTYTVTLTVKNKNGSSTIAKKVKIINDTTINDVVIATNSEENTEFPPSSEIHINEILPNPRGKDEGQEWLEISNIGNTVISLKGWRIATHAKKGPIIKTDLTIKPQSLLIIPQEFLPTLGNTNETVELLSLDGTIVDSVVYTSAPENQSYVLINGKWSWTIKLTPGTANIIIDSNGTMLSQNENKISGETSTTGFVVSLPGTLGAQYFYFQPEGSETLLQVYNAKKLFPPMELQQKIIVTGIMSSVATGPRIKTSDASDIITSSEHKDFNLSLSNSLNLKEPSYPRLVKIEGEVTSKKSPRLVVTDAQGDMEIYLTKGSNVSVSNFNVGDKLTVTGILELADTTLRILPRSEKDIILVNNRGPETNTDSQKINTNITTHIRDNKKQLFIYVTIGLIMIGGASGYGLWKYLKKVSI